MALDLADTNDLKLTDWVNEPILQHLKADLQTAQQEQTVQINKIKAWDNLLKVSGSEKPAKKAGRSSVQPKMVRRQAEWRYSALSEPFLGSNKLFNVTPVTFEDRDAARQNELVLNHQFKTKMNRIFFIDQLIRATVDEGTAVIRVGWNRQTRLVNKTVPTYAMYPITSEEQAQALQQAMAMREESIRHYEKNVPEELKTAVAHYMETGQPVVAIPFGSQEIQVEEPIVNTPTWQLVDPANFFIDPSCEGDIDKALYVIHSYETNKQDLEKNIGQFRNLDKIKWESSTVDSAGHYETNTPVDFSYGDKTKNKATVYEYWGYYDVDGSGALTPIVVSWIGNTIIRMERNPFPDKKFPFVIIPYLPVRRSVYGETDAELIGDNQRIAGALTRGMIDLMGRSANSQQGIAKGTLDATNLTRYRNGEDYEFNPTDHPSGAFYTHTFPEIPASALNLLTIQNQEAEAISGTKSFSGGLSGEAYGDVAAGIRGVLDASSKREMAILRRVAKGVADLGMKTVLMNGLWLSEKEVIRITNEEFVEVFLEDLQGNFDLEVDISTAEIDNAKANDLGFMLQTIGPNIDPLITVQLIADIADLKRMPDLANRLRKWKPEPTPQEQELMQLEIEEKRKQVEKLDSEIQLNQAKAQREMSQADKTNLDYVEQETGTVHAREMEKQKAQSEGNQNLAITKALVTPQKENETVPDIEAGVGYNALSSAQNTMERDMIAPTQPMFNLGSQEYDPRLDPSLNPAINI